MYFPLEVNEQLATAMRAAAELKSIISFFSRTEEKISPKRIDMLLVTGLEETMCDVINRIAELAGCVLACDVVDESNKQVAYLLNEMKA